MNIDEIVTALYRGILKREPDADGLAHYSKQLADDPAALVEVISLFVSLDEAFDRAEPQSRDYAIARLYAASDVTPLGNPRRWQQHAGNVIVFHVPKCGGTSLMSWLSAQYHPLQLGLLSDRVLAQGMEIGVYQKFFAWHMSWSQFSKIPRPAKTIFLLREPGRRLRSLYFFLQGLGETAAPAFLDAARAAASEDPAAFFASENPAIINHVNNGFVRSLTGAYVSDSGLDPIEANPPFYLDLALQRLQQFDCVFNLDALDDPSLPQHGLRQLRELTQELYGEALDAHDFPQLNAGPAGRSQPELDEWIEANSRLDIDLYTQHLARLA